MTLILLFSVLTSNSLFLIINNSSILMMAQMIIQTFLICIASKYLMNMSWLSFILFLVFVGGLLVLFIYIISLTPNTQFTNINISILILSATFLLSIMLNFLNMKYFILQNMKYSYMSNLFLLTKLYSNPSIWMTFMVMTYLLLVLIIVVYIIFMNQSSMKSLLIKN